jgi:hypothetical protein
MRALIVLFFLPLALAATGKSVLEGYVFREMDGGPPRRQLTIELIGKGRAFTFQSVRDGRHRNRMRFNEFVITEEFVTVASPGKNFKDWPGAMAIYEKAVAAAALADAWDADTQDPGSVFAPFLGLFGGRHRRRSWSWRRFCGKSGTAPALVRRWTGTWN